MAAASDTERLFQEFRRTRDPHVRERLIQQHQNLVHFLAAKFVNRGEPLDDLIQVGMIGLIHAVDRFDPERGLRFTTYATPTIVGEIKRYFRDRAWNLKVPRWLQERHVRVSRANEALTRELGRSPTIAEIAARVGCTEEEALDAAELGHAYETLSLESRVPTEGDLGSTISDSLGLDDLEIDRIQSHADLEQAVEQLDSREKAILYLRFFQELSQTEVARRLQISQMHVSRLQARALLRLREILEREREAEQEPRRDAA